VLAFNSIISLAYLGYHLPNIFIDDNSNDETHTYLITQISCALVLGLVGGISSFVVNRAYNEEFIANNIENSDLESSDVTEKYTLPISKSACQQVTPASFYLAEQFADSLSVSLSTINWMNTFKYMKLPTKISTPSTTCLFLMFYFPSLLPKLEAVAPDYIKNVITKKIAKHPKFFAYSSALAEASYDIISAVTAIPAPVLMTLLSEFPILTGLALAIFILVGTVVMSSENFLFSAKNVKDLLYKIQNEDVDIDDQNQTLLLAQWQSNLLKPTLLLSLGLVSLMYTRPLTAILSLTDINIWLQLLIIAMSAVFIALLHGNVETKTIFNEIKINPDAETLGKGMIVALKNSTQNIKNKLYEIITDQPCTVIEENKCLLQSI